MGPGHKQMTDTPLFQYTLRLADTALVLGHRLSEWVGHSPVIEEDLAFGNMGLDLIGQARSLYTYAGEIEGKGRDEDALAYLRDAASYRNLLWSSSRTATSPRPWCASSSTPPSRYPYFERADALEGRDARRHRRQGGQGDGLSSAPRRRVDDPSRRRHRGKPRARARLRSTNCGPMSARCSRSIRSSAR